MNTGSPYLSKALIITLSLIVGLAIGYFIFRTPASENNLTAAVTSILKSKTSQNWNTQLTGTVKAWQDNVITLQGEEELATVSVAADPSTQFIDSTANPAVPAPKSFETTDITIGDKLEITVSLDENALIHADFINRIATPLSRPVPQTN